MFFAWIAPGLSRAVDIASPTKCRNPDGGFGTILGEYHPPRRGSNPARNGGSGWRKGRRAEIFAPPDFRPTGVLPHPGR
jgi:hypothetical protein